MEMPGLGSRFPFGVYDKPRTDDEWRSWKAAGIDLMPCGSRERLDLAGEHGMFGWARMPLVVNDSASERKLRDAVEAVMDHPALAIWQAPDEPIHFASKHPPDGRPLKEPWTLSDEDRAEWQARLDTVVNGMARGAEIVRELDPTRPLWLNDTAGADRDALARVSTAFDVVGFDMYPVGRAPEQPLPLFGRVLDDYATCAPDCEVWPVQQAFSWSLLNDVDAEAFPTREELHFIAWQSLTRRVTGLHWWGIRHVAPDHEFLSLLWEVVSELSALRDLFLGADVPGVQVTTHYLRMPPILGVGHLARQTGDRLLFALVNEDPYMHTAVVAGIDPSGLWPVVGEGGAIHRTDDGWIVPIDGYGVRVFMSE